jgi:hypothetical protein
MRKEENEKLSNTQEALASIAGGALSALSTIPMDVMVAMKQASTSAGKKVGVMETFRAQLAAGGVGPTLAFATRGLTARVAHVVRRAAASRAGWRGRGCEGVRGVSAAGPLPESARCSSSGTCGMLVSPPSLSPSLSPSHFRLTRLPATLPAPNPLPSFPPFSSTPRQAATTLAMKKITSLIYDVF